MLKLYMHLLPRLEMVREREEGQTLVEYALIIALVSIGALLALGALSGGINGVFNDIVAAF